MEPVLIKLYQEIKDMECEFSRALGYVRKREKAFRPELSRSHESDREKVVEPNTFVEIVVANNFGDHRTLSIGFESWSRRNKISRLVLLNDNLLQITNHVVSLLQIWLQHEDQLLEIGKHNLHLQP